MEKKLKGQVALVTGASKGIGASIAEHLAEEGASVVVNYSSTKNGADQVVSSIQKNGGNAIAIKADIANPNEVKQLFDETKKKFGKLDILVNNAGVYDETPLEQVSEEKYRRMFDINVLGVLIASKEAAKLFGEHGGTIINISSVVSLSGMSNYSIYAATKGAVDAITRSLALELGPRKIRVNAINPGLVETEGTQNMDAFKQEIASQTPLGRVGQPKDIAQAVLFFASPHAGWITGQTLLISGGLL